MALVDAELTDAVRLVPTDEVVLQRSALSGDAIRLGEALTVNYGAVVREALRIRELVVGNEIGRVFLADAVGLLDRLLSARDALLVDGVGFAEALATQNAILILERLRLSEALVGSGIYQLTLTQSLRLLDRLARFFGADIADELGLSDEALTRLLSNASLVDGVGIETVVAPQLLLSVTATEGIEIAAADAVQMLFFPTLVEDVTIEAGYLAPDGSLTTWAMNTRTGAVTEYADYGFNSFARVGRRYLGASADGLFDLTGDDDDGDDIIARIKGGFMQFGGTQLSRLKEAYIAATGGGEFVLRITTKDGENYTYRSDTRSGRNTKVHMGKGMRARYFAFELISTGQDFDLDTLEFVPLVVQRRV